MEILPEANGLIVVAFQILSNASGYYYLASIKRDIQSKPLLQRYDESSFHSKVFPFDKMHLNMQVALFRKKYRRCAVHLIRVNKVQNPTEVGLAIME